MSSEYFGFPVALSFHQCYILTDSFILDVILVTDRVVKYYSCRNSYSVNTRGDAQMELLSCRETLVLVTRSDVVCRARGRLKLK